MTRNNKKGQINVRFSATEPLLRIFCEMDDLEKAENTCKILADYLSTL